MTAQQFASSPMIPRRPLLKVVLLGNSSVGKTSLLERYVNNRFTLMYKATIGADFLTKEVDLEGTQKVSLQIWDTAGAERFQSLGTHFYRGSDVCILVFDVTIRESFDPGLDLWRKEFLMRAKIDENTEVCPLVVIGNKVDRESERLVSKKEALQWCEKHGELPYLECSAKEAINVQQAFLIAAQLGLAHGQKNQIEDVKTVSLATTKKTDGCCS